MSNEGVSKAFTFGGMVGAVMAGLKLKDRWDDYRQVSQEEGRINLSDSPPAYRENDVGMNSAPLEGLELDTDVPAARPKRKRRDCCVCCGMNCGLFWKAIGIVMLIFLTWNAFKLIKWALTPSPTGLENMPVYSTSLGCLASTAPYVYNSSSKVTFTVPIGANKDDHALDIHGGAVGTVVLSPYPAEAGEENGVKYEISLRTDDEELLEFVDLRYPTLEEADESGRTQDSRFILSTPLMPTSGSSCMRYDITIFVPRSLKNLHVQSHTPAHVKFADAQGPTTLDNLQVTMYSMSTDNMILPTTGLQAKQIKLDVFRGWIVGDVPIVATTTLSTQRGDGVLNVRVHPVDVPAEDDADEDGIPPLAAAHLHTYTGSGRSDITYLSHSFSHRQIRSTHVSEGNGDLYLTYKGTGFNGPVNVTAKSYSMRNVQGGGTSSQEKNDRWVSDQAGSDRLVVQSPNGWVGLYF